MKRILDPGIQQLILHDGTIHYQLSNGSLHNSHGPAAIHPNGILEYYQNGALHREDGPAVEYIGTKENYPDFKSEYWVRGIQYSKEEFDVRNNSKNNFVP